VWATDGNLYGVTYEGGANNKGSIYRVTPAGEQTTLHSFDGTDGWHPVCTLIQASDGNLYGTTANGTTHFGGTIYRMSLSGSFQLIHGFDDLAGGNLAFGSLLQTPNGMLYGTTRAGGDNFAGTVFKLKMDGSGFTRIHSFSGGQQDGNSPSGDLSRAADGSLYGTTFYGGPANYGAIFKIDPNDNVTTIHTCTTATGASPYGPPIQARDGNLYGTMSFGGGGAGRGAVYRITPDGTYSILHTFAGSEGMKPYSGLVQGEDGDLYGSTTEQNLNQTGTVYKITTGGDVTTLHTFSAMSNNTNLDGALPSGALVVGGDGNLYGSTQLGGTGGNGTVYRLVTPKRRMLLQNQTDRRIAIMTVTGTNITLSRPTFPTLPAGWRVAAYADIDRDGQYDIVVQNTVTRAISILFMNGGAVRASKSLSPLLPVNWEVVASGDFNGDGRPDLVAQNVSTQQVSVLTTDGVRITGSLPLDQKLPPGWRVVGAGLFSADNYTDLVMQNNTIHELAVVTLQGTKVTGTVPLGPTLAANLTVGGVWDYDGDGKPDLALQDNTTGQLGFATVVNMGISSVNGVTPTPLAGWKLVGPR
jgi:uncharacterized repeat protein (TIGR03803 family)